jgi:hypothetical protein
VKRVEEGERCKYQFYSKEHYLMQYLFQSWKESLALFIPKNAKLFILVTIKTILQSYKLIVRDIWWLFVLSTGLDMMYVYFFDARSYFVIIPLFSWFITIFCMYLIIRPSLQRKGFTYYKEHSKYFIPFMFLSFFVFLLEISVAGSAWYLFGGPFTSLQHTFYLLTALLIPATIVIYASPFQSFMILFSLDREVNIANTGKSIGRGFKMAWYNYPFCLIVLLLIMAFSAFMNFITGQFYYLIVHALLPIPLSIWTNFYTKRLHDQFELYYPETVKE